MLFLPQKEPFLKVNIVDEIIMTFGPNQSSVRYVRPLTINLNVNPILHLSRLSIVQVVQTELAAAI
jgi:hypothetical protein